MPGGGAWNHDGVILFAPSLADGLYRVAENGGKPQLVLKLDSSKYERSYLWPQFLPDDKHFVFFVQTDLTNTTGVYAGTLDPPEYHRLFSSETNAVYSGAAAGDSSKSGYLLFIRDRHLMEQSFNISNLAMEGDPFTLADDIGAVRSMALAPISVSGNGILVYQSVGKPTQAVGLAGPQREAGRPSGGTGRLWTAEDLSGWQPRGGSQARAGRCDMRICGYWTPPATPLRLLPRPNTKALPSGPRMAPRSLSSATRRASTISM